MKKESFYLLTHDVLTGDYMRFDFKADLRSLFMELKSRCKTGTFYYVASVQVLPDGEPCMSFSFHIQGGQIVIH